MAALPALIVLVFMLARVPAVLAIGLSATVAAGVGVAAQQLAVDDALRAGGVRISRRDDAGRRGRSAGKRCFPETRRTRLQFGLLKGPTSSASSS